MKIFGKSDIGKKRDVNQDSYSLGYLANDAIYSVVCDGMGGQNAGHIASKMVCDFVSTNIKGKFNGLEKSEDIKNILIESAAKANDLVYRASIENPEYIGMGTTLISVIIYFGVAHIIHVGDSRVYHQDDKDIYQVTKDHSVVQSLLEQGKILKNEIENHPHKNIITKAVGVSPTIEIDYITVEIKRDDKIIICTDGLTNYCEKEIIFKIVKKNDVDQLCDIFIDYANDKGGYDNITVVVFSNN